MRLPTLAAIAALAATLAVTGADARSGTTPIAARPAAAAPDPAHFTHPVANPWFPLVPGTVTVLRGTDEGEHLRERVAVTHRTRTIQGIATTVVRDVLRRTDGTLAERTTDWYAADDSGNVWYFGERTATFDEHGALESREGSWEAGVDGARAGLIMPADPHATDAYRQEFFRGHAEDQAWIVGFKRTQPTPMRRFHHVLRTFEWTRLEPGVISAKIYAQGVGIVRERDLSGGSEAFSVVSVHHR